ncbi:MAG: GGDEF domain-containing protein [Deltaproteobacteria bacterium]|nr:GGDEF domain-containing protein [Deltaproteobacteria bacterium]
MNHDQHQVLGALLDEVAACARKKDSVRCRRLLDSVRAWGHDVLASAPGAPRTELEELRQKLHASKTAFETTVGAYKDLLETFEIFRSSIDIIQQAKRLDELPQAIEHVRQLRGMHALHMVLDQNFFGPDRPDCFGWAPSHQLREHMIQFTPALHWPMLYLGDINGVENPAFFLESGQMPDNGSCVIFALRHKYQSGAIIGFFAACDPSPDRYGPDKATDFLGHFCDILASTLVNALEHAQLEELSVRDSLTGVNNRAYLERHAPRILEFATRRDFPVHLCFIDLNGFKAVNDTLGHDAGDQILISVAQTIQVMVRNYDIFVRLGGDEFVVLLPDTDEAKAKSFRDRLENALDHIDVQTVCGHDTPLRVSASVGVARHQAGQTLDELLREADRLMYAAKSSKPQPPRTP